MKIFIYLFLLFSIPISANNNIDDYAYGYPLQLDSNGPIYKLDVTKSIYESLVDENYSDIRVFNAEQNSVPYFIEHKTDQIEQNSDIFNISFFPMIIDDVTSAKTASINIDTRPDGTIVNVNTNNKDDKPNNNFLLDLSQLEEKPSILSFKWDKDQADFNEILSVMGSDDLATWHILTNGISLANLHFSGQRLIKNTLELSPHNWKYLRISWPSKVDLMLKTISGQNATVYFDKPRQRISVEPDNYDDKTNSFFYSNKGRFPIDRISVKLKPRNSILQISVASSNNKNGPWDIHHQGLVYNLEKDGKPLSSDIINIYHVNDSYWRITTQSKRNNLASFSPTLELGWLPHTLTFIAEGAPPYLIAFGNNEAIKNNSGSAVQRLLQQQNEDNKILPARLDLNSRITFGGDARIQTRFGDSIDTKVIILWSVLILGLIILAMMAMQLYKQMKMETK